MPPDPTVPLPENHQAELRKDPSKCLYRYTFTDAGGDVRSSWHLPDMAEKRVEEGPDGCHKVRTKVFGHRARSALFLTVCELFTLDNPGIRHSLCASCARQRGLIRVQSCPLAVR